MKPTAPISHPTPYRGPSVDEVVKGRRAHLSDGQYWFYKEPLMLVQASQQYCWDDKGKKYIDAYSNVCHIGHTHPHVVEKCSKAMGTIVSNTRYLHPSIVEYAEKLKSKFPSKLNVCYFVNSGSEANDLALRLARIYTGKKPVICLEHAYHGTTASCTGISSCLSTGSQSEPKDFQYCKRDVYETVLPDPYRGQFRGSDPHAGAKYAEDVKNLCEKTIRDRPAAFIHESCQGVGGQIVYPPGYLQEVYNYIHSQGGVCIADEVQTGFGRSGTHFWAFEVQGVTPDIVVMGKPIGNGFPLGAVVTTREIAKAFDDCQYFNTAGGNPVACAAGLAVLEVIEREGLQENARVTSIEFMRLLQDLKRRHDLVGDVRGIGMFIGIELVRDRRTLEPAAAETALVMELLRREGVLVGKGGYHGNVLRIKPPICFNVEDARAVAHALDVVLTEVARRSSLHAPCESERHRQQQYQRPNEVPLTYVYSGGSADRAFTEAQSPVPARNSTKRSSYEPEYNDVEEDRSGALRRRLSGGAPRLSNGASNGSPVVPLDRLPSGLADTVRRQLH